MPGRSTPPLARFVPAPLVALLLGLGLLGLFVSSAAAADIQAPTSTGTLSSQLSELATPAVSAQPRASQAEALGLPSTGAGTLVREGDRVIVEARFEAGAVAAVAAVEAAGAKVLNVSARYQTLVLSVAPADLPVLSTVPGITSVTASLAPRVSGLGGSNTAAIASNGLCEGGSVITQGLDQLKVGAARAAFEARGRGETIGVISDSFDSATLGGNGAPVVAKAHDDEVTNDLPGKASTCSEQQLAVDVIAEDPPGQPAAAYTDEGRGMLQVIHDLAPHAKLAFATGVPSEISYAQNIEKLAAPVSAGGAGADVIVDDLSYESEPFFQEGPIGEAIRRVTEKGVMYFSAAGNDTLFNAAGNEISSWEAPEFRGTPKCSKEVVAGLGEVLAAQGLGPYEPDCMDFDPGAGVDTEFGITVEPGAPLSLDLQWAEPWLGVKTDLIALLIAGTGPEETVVAGEAPLALTPTPFIPLHWTNEAATPQTVRLVIARCSGVHCNPQASATADPRIKLAILEDGGGVSEIEYPKSEGGDIVGPVIYGHSGSPFATTIGAVKYTEGTAPKAPERYSSRGPVTHYFAPAEGAVPAAPLATPEVIQKPDVTATDCASTTFFAVLLAGSWHFCGTSEAAEHAATVAALMQQGNPLATPSQIVTAIESTATKFSLVNSPEAVGAGMVNALAALTAAGATKVDDPPSHVVPSIEEEEKAPAPTVTITKGPKPLGNESRPTFEFTSNRPVAFTCQVDGGTPQRCASPFVLPAVLTDGGHGFVVTATDPQGRSASTGIYSFTVDTKAPVTTIVGHPKKVVKTKKRNVVVHFKLKASESPVTFYCQIDKEPLRICTTRFHHGFDKGKHVLRVRARDEAGNLATKQAVYKFRVRELPPARPHRRGAKSNPRH
jgi:Subtilase family